MKIAILTSGGDSPGMNATIINLLINALASNHEVVFVKNGFNGLLDNDFISLEKNHISYYDYLYQSGSFIGSARSIRFINESDLAIKNLVNNHIDTLVVIGGNGSFLGAKLISKKIQVIFIPASIDNDVSFTNYCIGFSSCCNEVIKQSQKIISTFKTHQNIVIIEVMGRYCSDLVNFTSKALLPAVLINHETNITKSEIIMQLKHFYKKHHYAFILLAENIYQKEEIQNLQLEIEQSLNCSVRFDSLGYSQRGADVDFNDLYVAHEIAKLAINELVNESNSFAVVQIDGKFKKILFEDIKG